MSVTLRLARHGATHKSFFHIVAADHRRARNGKFIEKLGYYDPNCEPSVMEINVDRAQFWYDRGAEVSDAVQNILRQKKVALKRAQKVAPKKK